MILYTPLQIEEVLANMSQLTERESLEYNGQLLFVVKTEEGSYKIDQLLSTNPNDFMNPSYSPGTVLAKMTRD